MGRLKRQKAFRKTMDFYRMHFGVRQPYKVLLMGTSSHACCKSKINVRSTAAVLSDRDVECLVPRAAADELTAIGSLARMPPCFDIQAGRGPIWHRSKTGMAAASPSAAEGILKLVVPTTGTTTLSAHRTRLYESH